MNWESYMRENQGLTERTIEEYKKDMTDFREWMAGYQTKVADEDINCAIIQGYINACKRGGQAATTIKRKVSSIRNYFGYMKKTGIRKDNPATDIDTPRVRMKLTEVPDMDKVRSYLEEVPKHREDVLLQAITALITTTGVRISEALSISRNDINKNEMSITIHGKGQRERKVYYSASTRDYLNAWCKLHGGNMIFQGWSDRDIRDLMRAKIKTNGRALHPHALRHLFASQAYDNGAELNMVKALLGHADIKSTQRYVHVAPKRAREATMRFAPQI